jgi:hypothetical protein
MKIMCLSGATCLPVGAGNEDNVSSGATCLHVGAGNEDNVSEWSNMSTCRGWE